MSERDMAEIRRRLAALNRMPGGMTFYATVEAVDDGLHTCTVEADGVAYEDVRLNAVAQEEGRGLWLLPKVGSTVLVTRIGDSNELLVVMASEVDGVKLTIGDTMAATLDKDGATVTAGETMLQATADGLTLTRGEAGLLKTLTDLCDAILRLTVSTAVGPSSTPVNAADFASIKNELKSYLKG